MQINVKSIHGWVELQAAMRDFSERRAAAVMATAFSKTVVDIKAAGLQKLPSVFDRPSPWTMNSLYVKGATAQNLQARVWFKEDAGRQGTPAAKYLLPQVEGGQRKTKRYEAALQAFGALPSGWQTVPGVGAHLDAYGNVSVGQIIQILSQLRITMTAGHQRNMSFDARKAIRAQKKAGGRFFVVPVGTKGMAPGVYQREFMGRTVTPVLVFVQASGYRKRFDFHALSRQVAEDKLPVHLREAVRVHLARAAAKGGR
jgi:hypothetical protein